MALGRTKPAKVVGRYQLAHELAPSYLGPLWAVRVDGAEGAGHLAMLRLVSLSRLDADTRVRLLEAAWQAMEVRDDRVCPVTDVVASDGELSIVSDYSEGLPLRALQGLASVRRKPLAISVALRIVTDLIDGVAALHRAMVELGEEAVPLYGGLSPDSILVGTNGRTSVLDVAVASVASSVESLGGNPERVAYAAPEQLTTPSRADPRSDVFTIGIIAWELLSGRRLFVGSDKAVGQKVLAAKIPRIDELRRKGDPEIPGALSSMVTKALERDPEARFTSIDELARALGASGIAVAEPAEVEAYVAMVAEGALSRTRDALKDPVSKVRQVANPWSKLKPPESISPKAPAAVLEEKRVAQPRPAAPTALRRPVTTAAARPHQATMIGIPAPARLEMEAAAKAVAALPVEDLPAPATRAVVPIVGPVVVPDAIAAEAPTETPVPASGRFESIPPVPHRLDEASVRPPMPSEDGSEEPTGQYTARDLLKQVEEMARRSDRARRPPTDFPEPATSPNDGDLLGRRAAQLQPPPPPNFGAIEEDAWLDDPTGPVSASDLATSDDDTASTTVADPDAGDGFLDEPLTPPPARVESLSLARPERTLAPPGPEPTNSVRPPQERKIFSKLPPSASGPGFIPSQIPPPLIHDPRARRGMSARVKTADATSPSQFTRAVVIGIVVSVALVLASATIAVVALRGRDKEEPAMTVPTSAQLIETPSIPPQPAVAAPPADSAAPVAAAPAPAVNPTTAPATSAVLPPAPVETTLVATPPTVTNPAPHVAAGGTSRSSAKKKRARFVPDDI